VMEHGSTLFLRGFLPMCHLFAEINGMNPSANLGPDWPRQAVGY